MLNFIHFTLKGHLTTKSDVYSFGVVLLEMLSGRRAVDKNRPNGEHNLVDWARPYLMSKRKIFRVLDTRLGGQYPLIGAQKAATLALQCLSPDARYRPTMDHVVAALEQLQDAKNVARIPQVAQKSSVRSIANGKVPTTKWRKSRKLDIFMQWQRMKHTSKPSFVCNKLISNICRCTVLPSFHVCPGVFI